MRSFGSKPMTHKQGLDSFRHFLGMATDEKVLAMTLERALCLYRMDKREAECLLLAAQGRRRRAIAEREEVVAHG